MYVNIQAFRERNVSYASFWTFRYQSTSYAKMLFSSTSNRMPFFMDARIFVRDYILSQKSFQPSAISDKRMTFYAIIRA